MVSKQAVNGALSKDQLISDADLEQRVEKIPKTTLDQDETVNVFRVKKYFSNSAWKKMKLLLKRVEKEKSWDCKTCDRELKNYQALACDVCLEWYHLKCIGKLEPPKAKTWVCRSCIKNHATMNAWSMFWVAHRCTLQYFR